MTASPSSQLGPSKSSRFDEATSSKIKDLFVDFLQQFGGFQSADKPPKYLTLISSMPGDGSRSLVVDCIDLIQHDNELALRVQLEPRKFLRLFDQALLEVLAIYNPDYARSMKQRIHIRIKNLPGTLKLQTLDSSSIGRLVMVSGIVTRMHQLKSISTVAAWACIPLNHITFKEQDFTETTTMIKPLVCGEEDCGATKFYLKKSETQYTDFQTITIQEMPEDLQAGEIPRSYEVFLFDDMVERVRPGDRVSLVAVFNTVGLRESTKALSQVSDNKLFANYIEAVGRRPEDLVITREEEDFFRAFANAPGALDRLIQSLDPAIQGQDVVKEGMLYLLAGSQRVMLENGTALRGDISMLLVGDPGIAKSQLLKTAVNVSPRAFYVPGLRASAAGLGVAVIREPSGGMVLTAGAAVHCDLGVLAIDEFAQLHEEDMGALNEIMEQQSASIAKAGFNVNLNARTSILAAMNPINGKYDPFNSFIDNVGSIPIPILTRFDLIFVMRDEPDPDKDDALGRHIGVLRQMGKFASAPPLDHLQLKRYIAFAKKINPRLTDECYSLILEKYKELRQSQPAEAMTVTPRWLEGMIRIALASARLMLREETTVEDALRATGIIEKMLHSTLVDPTTKKVDVGLLYNRPISEAGLRESGLQTFKNLSGESKQPVEDMAFYEEMEKLGKFTQEQIEKIFQDMWRSGVIYEVRPHFFKKA